MANRRTIGWRVVAVAAMVALAQACLTIAHAAEPKALRGVALVIGESAYEHVPPLTNPENDARAIEKLLNDLGFETDVASDRDARKLRRDLEDFVDDAEGADVAVIYYSGHGIEAGGENFLVPVDADFSALENAGKKLVPLSGILADLKSKVPVTIVLLDACRNNPFPPGSVLHVEPGGEALPVAASGLGESRSVVALKTATDAQPSDANLGQVIGFAAEPGKVALDGPADGNSPYAAAILRHLGSLSGQEFGLVLRMIGEEVYLKTGGKQRPWVNESLRRLLYFGVPEKTPDGEDGEILRERRGLLLAIADLSEPERQEIETVSRDGGVPMDALYAMLKVLGADRPKDPAELEKLLRGQTEKLKAVLAERSTLKSTDPEIKRLSDLADRAIDEGALDATRKFHELAKKRVGELVGTVDQAEADVKARRLEFAEVFADSAETNSLAFNFKQAAEDYAQAFAQVERWDDDKAFAYKQAQAIELLELGSRAGNQESIRQAVSVFGDAGKFVSRDTKPLLWAAWQNNLALASTVLGENETASANLESAAQAYEAALTIFTRDASPDDWALASNNLGAVYWELGKREVGTGSLLKAAEIFRSVPRLENTERSLLLWAAARTNLGNVLADLGEQQADDENLRLAVTAQQDALKVYTRDAHPLDWATGKTNLAAAYTTLGDRDRDAAMLRQAVAANQDALQVYTLERAPAHWASIQNNLSSAWLGIAEVEGGTDALREAVASAEMAVSVWTRAESASNWANGQLTLGNALLRLGKAEASPDQLRRAVSAYTGALEEYSRERLPRDWASLQRNLGTALDDLGDLETDTASFERAAMAYRNAAEVLTKDNAAKDFGSIQFDLGNTLSSWGERAGDANVMHEAVAAYDAALEVQKSTPTEWATTKYRRGSALMQLGKLESDDATLARSASDYMEALDEQMRSGTPDRQAATNWALGHVLTLLADHTHDNSMFAEASSALESALPLYPRDADPDSWAQIQAELGTAYYYSAAAANDTALYRKATSAYEAALTVYDVKPDRQLWAQYQGELGNALLGLGSATADAALLTKSVKAYDDALTVSTREKSPEDWERNEINLATALSTLGYYSTDTAALSRSAAVFRQLGSVRTRERDSAKWAELQEGRARALGVLMTRVSDPAILDEALAVNTALADFVGREKDPARWANIQNEIGYTMTLAAKTENNPSRLERAVPILRDAVAVQRNIKAIPAIAYTQDTLCEALTELGVIKQDKAMVQEAIESCESALSIFAENAMAELADGSTEKLAEAKAVLAKLN